jgi:homoserine dehydrogenase
MEAADRPGVLAEIATILGDAGISIEAVVQPEPPRGAERARLIMLTHRVRERQMNAALEKVATLDVVNGPVTRIRVEHLNGD